MSRFSLSSFAPSFPPRAPAAGTRADRGSDFVAVLRQEREPRLATFRAVSVRGLALAAAGWLFGAFAAPQVTGAATIIDQSFTNPPYTSSATLSLTGDTLYAQSFTVETAGLLTGADLLVFDGTSSFGSGAPPVSDLIVQIRSLTGGLPDATVLTSLTVPAASLLPDPDGQFIHVDFPVGVPVVAGQVLALGISGAGVGWFGQFGDQATYAGGQAFRRPHNGDAWEPILDPFDSELDFLFRTYVTEIPEPSALPLMAGGAVVLFLGYPRRRPRTREEREDPAQNARG